MPSMPFLALTIRMVQKEIADVPHLPGYAKGRFGSSHCTKRATRRRKISSSRIRQDLMLGMSRVSPIC